MENSNISFIEGSFIHNLKINKERIIYIFYKNMELWILLSIIILILFLIGLEIKYSSISVNISLFTASILGGILFFSLSQKESIFENNIVLLYNMNIENIIQRSAFSLNIILLVLLLLCLLLLTLQNTKVGVTEISLTLITITTILIIMGSSNSLLLSF
jgi:hypothetical protein